MMRFIAPKYAIASRVALPLLIVAGASLYSCKDDIQPGSGPELSFSQMSLTFSAPRAADETSEVSLVIHNTSRVNVQISEVTLEEEDESPEVALLDADDWTSEAIIFNPDEQRTLKLSWAPINQQRDRGTLTIVSSAGTYEIPFESPDLDPSIYIESDREGELDQDQRSVTLSADRLKSRVKIRSIGLAPLNISRLCFIDSDDSCLSAQGEAGRGQLSLCQVSDSERCDPYTQDEPLTLLSGEERSFEVRYLPLPSSVDSVAARVLIESDSSEDPRYVLRVEGEPCEDCLDPAGEEPPPAGEEPPPAGEEPPPAGEEPPPAGEEPPPAGEEPPPAGEDPPPAGEEPPPAGEEPPLAGEEPPPEVEHVYDVPGVHTLMIPDDVSEVWVTMWGAGGAAGNQLGANGGGAASARFLLSLNGARSLVIWVGEGGSSPGEGGGGSFLWSAVDSQDPTLLAAIAGGGGGASDGNSGRSYIGGRGGAGGWSRGQDGQSMTGHQQGPMLSYCRLATGGEGATSESPGAGGASEGTANGCQGQAGIGRQGGAMTSRPSGNGVTCIAEGDHAPWESAPSQWNGGGGGGGGGYFGGGSGGFIWTYCGGGGGGGSSWITTDHLEVDREGGQARTPGRAAESDGAGYGGQRLDPELEMDPTLAHGANGRVIITW